MEEKILRILLCLFLTLQLSENLPQQFTQQREEIPPVSQFSNPKEVEQRAVEANTQFATDFINIVNRNADCNLIFSPYSISQAFGMVYAGAERNTAEEISRAFYFYSYAKTPEDVHATFKKFNGMFSRKGKPYSLNTASNIFVDKSLDISRSFQSTIEQNYNATPQTLNFLEDAEGSRNIINSWVAEKTENKIPNLYPAGTITPDTRLVIANAIYFKGTWKTSFDPSKTKLQEFRNGLTLTSQVPMMSVSDDFLISYDNELRAKVLKLPYTGDDLSMIIVLPDADDGLKDVLPKLNPRKLSTLTSSLSSRKVNVKLPKFKIETEIDLKENLRKQGVNDLFDKSACMKLEENGSNPYHVESILHKAVLEVDEVGSIASASSGIAINGYALNKLEEFKADHPFLFFIMEQETGLINFLGTYTSNEKCYKNPTLPVWAQFPIKISAAKTSTKSTTLDGAPVEVIISHVTIHPDELKEIR